ncbi:helix-turn-helix domain-containing protein [Verrucomicrobiales bacterium BCK34]|nr:helix-turn-helix domain-containing protein [Verrucomicrobiales bacterium BCK34]
MATIGQELGNTRREKGLSIEDVAHETHIHTSTIRSIEADDFSMFPSVAYAKSFIRNYSEYLDVDVADFLEDLSTSETNRFSDNELMGEMKDTIKKDSLFRGGSKSLFPRRRPGKPGGAPVFLNFILAVLIAAFVIFYFLGYNASSIDEAKSEITNGLKKANPFGHEDGDAEGAAAGEGLTAEEMASGKLSFEDELPSLAKGKGSKKGAIPPPQIPEEGSAPVTFGEADQKAQEKVDLPAMKRPEVEPKPELRPEGTDPVAIPKPEAVAERRPAGAGN